MPEQEIGKVTHYFGKIQVAAVEITDSELRTGDTVHVTGHSTDFTQTVDSMQINNQPVQQANAGACIGIKVAEPVRENDRVYKVTPE